MKNAVFYFLIFLSTGCASYQWGTGDRNIPGGHKKIMVPLFINLTQEVGAEIPFTKAMSKEIERSSFSELVDGEDHDVILRGTVQQIDVQGFGVIDVVDPGDSRARGLNTAYQIRATILIELLNPKDGNVIWSSSVSGSRGYNGPKLTQKSVRTANPLYNKSAREQNLTIVANELMSEAFDKMTERF